MLYPLLRFVATDKPVVGRRFLHVVDVPLQTVANNDTQEETSPLKIFLDMEWLAILKRNIDNIPIGNVEVETSVK